MTINNFSKYLKINTALFICLLLCISCKKTVKNETENEVETEVDSEWIDSQGHLYEYGICVDSLNVTVYTIKNGDNLSSIFSKLGFSARMTDSLCRASTDVIDPRKLRSGMSYTTISEQDSIAVIRYIVFAKSMTDFSIIDITGDSINTYEYNKEVSIERRYIEGEITSSLWNIIKANGADPLLALKISDILAWQVDFFDVKKGDSFRVTYDVAFIDDTTELSISSVEGLVFVHQGKEFTAIPFMQDSILEYFDAEGNSLRKAFLKAPLDFFRIT